MSGFFREQAALNSRIVSEFTCASERELSPRVDCRQILASCSSVRGGTSFAAIGAVPNVPHTATQRHTPISASAHTLVSQPPVRSFAADSQPALYPFYPNAAQVKYLEFHRLDDGRRCVERAECKTVHMPGIEVGVNQEMPYVDHGSTRTRNDHLLSCVEEYLGPLSQTILDDADELLSIAPNVLDESVLYNRNWTVWDMIRFNGILIDELEITCQWGATCNDRLKVKEIKTHLMLKHDVKSTSKSYRCFWHECLSEPMTHLSSLARHVKECHGSVYKYWPCPTCDWRFTRDETLLRHFKKCPGRGKLQVVPRGEIVSGQRFA